jgi:hypothetical protein
MSQSRTTQSRTPEAGLHPDGVRCILVAIASRLIPYFLGSASSRNAALATAIEALTAYNPQTLADYFAAARHISLSFATLVASEKAADPELPEKQQLQYMAKANTLNRTVQRIEATLPKSRSQPPSQQSQQTSQPGARHAPAPAFDDLLESAISDFYAMLDARSAANQAAPMHATLAHTAPAQTVTGAAPLGG